MTSSISTSSCWLPSLTNGQRATISLACAVSRSATASPQRKPGATAIRTFGSSSASGSGLKLRLAPHPSSGRRSAIRVWKSRDARKSRIDSPKGSNHQAGRDASSPPTARDAAQSLLRHAPSLAEL